MFKINTFLLYLTIISSICITVSCNKTEQDSNKVQVKTDSVKKHTEPNADTTTQTANSINKDSVNEQKAKEKKRRNDSLRALKETEVKLTAYYFHPTARCVTCLNIEAYSLEAIQQWEEKNKIKVSWHELNIEDSVNEHYIDEYNLQFSSLIIVKYIGGKKDKWKNLEETWKLVNDKSSFIKFVKHELTQFAKEKS